MFKQPIKNFCINFNVSNERSTFSSGDQLTGHISFDLTKDAKITSITLTLTGKLLVGEQNFSLAGMCIRLHASCQRETSHPSSTGFMEKILYTLTVGINRPWHFSKDFVTELNFVNRIDTNQPVLRSPLSGTNNMTLCCLWCVSGPISMTATTEKKAFVPGEAVKIVCDFTNASFRAVTPKVKLQQKQVFYTHGKEHQKMVSKSLTSVTGQPISAHTSDVHTEIMLTVPSSASLTISNCSIVHVDYTIEVSLSVRASHDLTVLIPIVLCDTPVYPHPPNYQ